MPTTVVQPGDTKETARIVQQAAQVFKAGGLVVFPTETVYGLGAAAAHDAGYAALRAFKGRSDEQPFTVHVPDAASAHQYADLSHPLLKRLVRKVLPGPVTLVVDVSETVAREKLAALGLPDTVRERIYHQGTVGLRCPDHALGQKVLAAAGGPVVASSANRRGEAPPHDADQAARFVGEAARLVVDGGPCQYAKPSTILRVQLAGKLPKVTVQRAGVFDERYVRKLLRWTVLLVCSGNTCRSPMAEGLARQLLAQGRGVAEEGLEAAGVVVQSAGVFAAPGLPASPEAVEAMRRFGVDLSRHRTRALSAQLIQEADVVYCMTAAHLRAVIGLAPTAAEKAFLLDPQGDVEDPMGASVTAYQRCAEQIRRRLEQRLKEQQP